MKPTLETSLNIVKKEFESFPLDIVLIAINRACRQWEQGDTSFNLRVLKECEPQNPTFYWMAAETARHAIAWCIYRRHNRPINDDNISREQLEHLIDLASNAQIDLPFRSLEATSRLTSDPLLDIACRLWMPQYLLQRYSGYRVGQARLLYQKAPERRYKRDPQFPLSEYRRILSSILGCELEFFLFSCLQLQGMASGENPCISIQRLVPLQDRRYDRTFFYDHHPSGLIIPRVQAVIKRLSASPNEIIAQARQPLEQYDELAIIKAPNPLLSYPLIQPFPDRSDYAIAPVPHLITEWLYEPLIDKFFAKRNQVFTNRHISQIFEEYVGLIADLCSPDHQAWIPENVLEDGYSSKVVGSKVVDWAKDLGNTVVLIDAKRTFMSNEDKYKSLPERWKECDDYWHTGAHQAEVFWKNGKSGKVPRLSDSKHKPAIAVLVTHMDSDYRALHHDTIKELTSSYSIPCIVLSVDRYEQIMMQWSRTKDPEWLSVFLEKAVNAEDFKNLFDDEIPLTQDGVLWDERDKLIENLKTEIEGTTNI